MSAKFITIEGIEGAGKSTAMAFIQTYLQEAEKPFVMTREPGGTKIAEAIREILLNPAEQEPMDPKTELLLMFASRAQHVARVIFPALKEGKWVICDRFVDATYAYQSAGRGIGAAYLAELEHFVVGHLRPDATILLDIDPEEGLARSKKRGPQDRFEKEKLEFFEKVRHAYLERAAQDKKRFHLIQAGQPLMAVQEQILGVLEKLI